MNRTTATSLIVGIPPLTRGRPHARALVGDLPRPLIGETVIVDARDQLWSSESFVDELVVDILVDGGAALMHVLNVTDETAAWFRDSAADLGVSDRITVEEPTRWVSSITSA